MKNNIMQEIKEISYSRTLNRIHDYVAYPLLKMSNASVADNTVYNFIWTSLFVPPSNSVPARDVLYKTIRNLLNE